MFIPVGYYGNSHGSKHKVIGFPLVLYIDSLLLYRFHCKREAELSGWSDKTSTKYTICSLIIIKENNYTEKVVASVGVKCEEAPEILSFHYTLSLILLLYRLLFSFIT